MSNPTVVYCAIPFLARLQSSEAKPWKVQGLFDGRWKGDSIVASLELSQTRHYMAFFLFFSLFLTKLAFKMSGGHHSTAD